MPLLDMAPPLFKPQPEGTTDVIFLGSGCSSATPHLHCLLGIKTKGKAPRNTGALHPPAASAAGDEYLCPCPVCARAVEGLPLHNRNYRGNPSLLIRYRSSSSQTTKHVLIDAGKTFREAAQRWMGFYRVQGLDSVILTHEHADAVLGIDDLRSTQRARPLPVHASEQCFGRLKHVFPYLMPTVNHDERLFVASLDWRVLPDLVLTPQEPSEAPAATGEAGQKEAAPTGHTFRPLDKEPFEVTAFPVEHGPGFMSLGFAFGEDHAKFVYISDVSRIPEPTLELLKSWRIKILVLDCLDPGPEAYPTHFSLPQALDCIRELSPAETWLVGMNHRFSHIEGNRELQRVTEEEGLVIELAYDGLCLEV